MGNTLGAVAIATAVSWLGACSTPDTERPWFREVSASRGLEFVHVSGQAESGGRLLFPDIMGAGAALADVDGDDDLDVYLVQSGYLLPAPQSTPVNRLFINDGRGGFEPAEDPGAASDSGYGMGVTAGDYDNDGDIDLYVTNLGPNVLLQNDGAGRFADATATAGVGHAGFSTAATFVDLDRDGWLDLFVVNYIDWNAANERACFFGNTPTYCPPTNYASPAMDVLYRNNGDGTFSDVTEASGITLSFGRHAENYRASRPGLGVIGGDFNLDGLVDVFVANDLMADQLWINKGSMTFEDQAPLWGCDVDEHGIAKAGMGVDAVDLDNDRDLDLLVVNNIRQTDSLFRNETSNGSTFFSDITSAAGLGATSRRNTRFGVTLSDFDNDGWSDLYHANGAVALFAETTGDPYAQPNVLYRSDGSGRFIEMSPPGGAIGNLVHTSRGLAVGDIDNDGGLDLLVSNRDAQPYLLINAHPRRGRWIGFRAIDQNGRDALHAELALIVENKTLHQIVQTAGSYLASNDPRVHFGLGNATPGQVTVRWPDGTNETFGPYDAGAYHALRQGTGAK